MKTNRTAIRSYSLSNDKDGKIILKLVNVIWNKPVRSKYIMDKEGEEK